MNDPESTNTNEKDQESRALLSDPASHGTAPVPGVQPIGDVADFLKTLPHLTPKTTRDSMRQSSICAAAAVPSPTERAGRRLEAGDAWIAATAYFLTASLLTHDRDFAPACPSLTIITY